MTSILSSPENQYITLFGIAAFGLLQLFCVLLFWFCHLRHHQNHPVYRIRHPLFWVFSMGFCSFQITWKAMTTYARLKYHISENYYMLSNQIGVLLIGYGCVFARGFVLWYTVKFQQQQETQLFEKVLISERYESSYALEHKLNKAVSKNNPFLQQYEKYISNPMCVFAALQSLYVLLVSISALCNFFVSPKVSKFFIIGVVMLFWAILAALVYDMWRNEGKITYKIADEEIEISSRWKDHFNFRWEVTIIWIDIFIFVPLRSWISIKFKIDETSAYANKGLVILAFLTLLSQLFPVLTQICVPYWTYASRKASVFQKKFENTNDITVFDVLADKHGFFLFVNHAVQELNVENVSALIAIYQFKHIKTSKHQLLSINTNSTTKSALSLNPLKSRSSTTRNGDAVIGITSSEPGLSIIKTPVGVINANDVEVLLPKLSTLPWQDMALSESMSNLLDTKCGQARKVYNKFFAVGSIYTVNVSGAVRDYVSDIFWNLQQLHEEDKSTEQNEQFQEDLLKVFDCALPDLCSNLMDIMDRFRNTKEFQSLSIA